MKNFKTAIFTVAFVFCLTIVKAQDTKSVKEKTAKPDSASELKASFEPQIPTITALDKRRLKTKHETAKNSISNVR